MFPGGPRVFGAELEAMQGKLRVELAHLHSNAMHRCKGVDEELTVAAEHAMHLVVQELKHDRSGRWVRRAPMGRLIIESRTLLLGQQGLRSLSATLAWFNCAGFRTSLHEMTRHGRSNQLLNRCLLDLRPRCT